MFFYLGSFIYYFLALLFSLLSFYFVTFLLLIILSLIIFLILNNNSGCFNVNSFIEKDNITIHESMRRVTASRDQLKENMKVLQFFFILSTGKINA
jgi:cell division protein FtsL